MTNKQWILKITDIFFANLHFIDRGQKAFQDDDYYIKLYFF